MARSRALLIFTALVVALGVTILLWRQRRLPAPAGPAGAAASVAGGDVAPSTSKAAADSGRIGGSTNAARARSRAALEPPEQRWRRLIGAPPTIERDADLADAIEEIADTDPDLAARLLLGVPTGDRQRIVAAVLIDAARRPANASRMASEFVRADAAGSTDHGYALVSALSRAAEFESALQFVLKQDAAGQSEDPGKWLRELFTQWARANPEQARERAATLPSESARAEAQRCIDAVTTRH